MLALGCGEKDAAPPEDVVFDAPDAGNRNTPTARPENPRAASFQRKIPWIGQGIWLKADLHTHTTFSDGIQTVAEVVQAASEQGCDVIAITDHGDLETAGASPEYFAAIDAVRAALPHLVVLAGMEWNVPPYGGDEHITVLTVPETESKLTEFKASFDDEGREGHSDANEGLEWLVDNTTHEGVLPVVIYNHPSRKDTAASANVRDMLGWREVNTIVVAFEGAPGHQRAKPLGSYKGRFKPMDRWDPVAAEVGGGWDRVLGAGHQVGAALANSDFHDPKWREIRDPKPGEFSETWIYAQELTPRAVLLALRAGSYFAAHGHIVREARLTVVSDGLDRPAEAGEIIEVIADAPLVVELRFEVPETDFGGQPNHIDEIELILVRDASAESVLRTAPATEGPALRYETFAEDRLGDLVFRARGRRIVEDGPDLMFYTNAIRVKVRGS